MPASKRSPSYSNLVSTMALVIAVTSGGVAAAAVAKNSIRSAHIVNRTITSADIKPGTITGSRIDDRSVTGDDIDESTLTKVRSALTAGTASSVSTLKVLPRVSVALGAAAVVSRKGPLTLTLECVDYGDGEVGAELYIDTSANNASFDSNVSGDDVGDLDVADGAVYVADDSSTTQESEQVGFAALTPSGELWQGFGITASKFGGANACFVDLVFIG